MDQRVSTISIPEPTLTPRALIARAAALRPRLLEQQDENDERGHYSEELHREFLNAGFYRITQPRLFGGYEFEITTFYRVMLEISRGHPGVGWCLTLGASHAFVVGAHWPEQAQREFFGRDGHFISPHRPPPLGTLTPVDGGYLLQGSWDYCSGIPYANYFIGGAFIRRDGESPVIAQAALSRDKVTVLHDWGGDRVLGMRASGSNSVRVDDVFVPKHHVVVLSAGLSGTPESMANGTHGTRLHGNPMYLGRLAGPFHASLVVPIVGAARAALDEFEEIIRARKTMSVPTMQRFQHFDYQRPFGAALTLTDAAEALLIKGCEMYHDYCRRWAEHGTPITTEENMRLWGMLQHAGSMACEAVELLFYTAGSTVARKGSRMQRYFNDVAMYRGHLSSQQQNFASGLARLHFGLPWGMYGL
jgi:3-hydroxy-9,10-secoandrosta-1,3,5(10)-triene-9,17-dione monooxygenase